MNCLMCGMDYDGVEPFCPVCEAEIVARWDNEN